MAYKHILVATDLHSDALPVVRHAVDLVRRNEAKLTIVNVIPAVPYYMASGLSSVANVEEELADQAKSRFERLKPRLKDVDVDFIITHGSAKVEIVKTAKNLKADLVVVGSHGRNGVRQILGSTANGVSHRAPCDVLIVRSDSLKHRARIRLQHMRSLKRKRQAAEKGKKKK